MPLDDLHVGVTLSNLVAAGAEAARLIFPDANVVTNAAQLADSADVLFTPYATAPAVAIIMTNDPQTVAVLLAAIRRGITLVSIPLPGRGSSTDAYLSLIRSACEFSGAVEVVARDDVADLLAEGGIQARAHSRLSTQPLAVSGGDFTLVQHSSGSSGAPKGVALSDAALGANVMGMLEALQPSAGDTAVSWLPLSHDMGLIGMTLTAIAAMGPVWATRGDVVVLDPSGFLRDPTRWIAALSTWSGTFTAAPDFGFRMATEGTGFGDWHLSGLRCAIVGGDVVRAETLNTFTERFSANGVTRGAMCPAYGLAEIGLAATITRPQAPWRQCAVNAGALGRHEIVQSGNADVVLVSSGTELSGYNVTCPQVTSHRIGQISIRGPSMGRSPVDQRSLAPDGCALPTGDVGFMDDGWLYVCGRSDDYFLLNGRNVFAPEVEARVGATEGIRGGRVAAFGVPTGEWVVVAEMARESLTKQERQRLASSLRRAAASVCGSSPNVTVLVSRGRVPMTASGKLRRSEAVRMYLDGSFAE
jgi:acyl-CoA synthetase (AMP-forming)/AMP-acid ligase II